MAPYSKYTYNNVSFFSISSQSFILVLRERERREGGGRQGKMKGGRKGGRERERAKGSGRKGQGQEGEGEAARGCGVGEKKRGPHRGEGIRCMPTPLR